MVTTIQIDENVKKALDRLKENKETYEEIIINLMKIAEKCKRDNLNSRVKKKTPKKSNAHNTYANHKLPAVQRQNNNRDERSSMGICRKERN